MVPFWSCLPRGGGEKAGFGASYKQGCQKEEVVASAHTQLQVTSVTTININGLTLLSTSARLSSCLSGPTPSGRGREGGREGDLWGMSFTPASEFPLQSLFPVGRPLQSVDYTVQVGHFLMPPLQVGVHLGAGVQGCSCVSSGAGTRHFGR